MHSWGIHLVSADGLSLCQCPSRSKSEKALLPVTVKMIQGASEAEGDNALK
jgi:hypothetical protein